MKKHTFLPKQPRAILALADGSVFSGFSIGVEGIAIGEAVFNTAMTGYQEILTDPSYAEQIVTLTYPHIGNVGVNSEDEESKQVWAKGLVIRELSPRVSNWRSQTSLTEYLQKNSVIAIAGIDTRRLTRILCAKGAQNACLMAGEINEEVALAHAQNYPGLSNQNLTSRVTLKQSTLWQDKLSYYGKTPPIKSKQCHVVVYDFGVKHSILQRLAARGCKITLVPAETSAEKVLALAPDGILLSNGPGDPAACHAIIHEIQNLLQTDIPIFGICLGFQLLALASGAKTIKMKFGHHGANHPVQSLLLGKTYISSQNHGFMVDEKSLPSYLQVTYRSLFDGSIQGFTHLKKPILAFQGHPEAGPGPQDVDILFDRFMELIKIFNTKNVHA